MQLPVYLCPGVDKAAYNFASFRVSGLSKLKITGRTTSNWTASGGSADWFTFTSRSKTQQRLQIKVIHAWLKNLKFASELQVMDVLTVAPRLPSVGCVHGDRWAGTLQVSAGTKVAPPPWLWWSQCLRWTLRRVSEPPDRKGSEELDLSTPGWQTWKMRLTWRRWVHSLFNSMSIKDVLWLACVWLNSQKMNYWKWKSHN